MRELPHATVATIVEDNGKFLLVKELRDNKIVYNQPAGHIENNESPLEAAHRETLEETGWKIELTGFQGIYQYKAANGTQYIRHCFTAKPVEEISGMELDDGIISAHWMPLEEINQIRDQLRSPLVLRCFNDYVNLPIYPLEIYR